jgi:hypothetical protein
MREIEKREREEEIYPTREGGTYYKRRLTVRKRRLTVRGRTYCRARDNLS